MGPNRTKEQHDMSPCSGEGLTDFLRAAKVNPGNAVPFLYLGHAYRARGDLEKARKCYQKSFHLDPGSTEAAVALSDVLRDQGAADANSAHLRSVVARSPSASDCRWAHVRLGVLYLSRELQDLKYFVQLEYFWNFVIFSCLNTVQSDPLGSVLEVSKDLTNNRIESLISYLFH